MLLFKAVIEHVQETKPYGWDEAFDHFVMDVIQARGLLSRPGALLSLRRDIAYPMSRMVKGDKMVSRLSVFSTAFLFRILQFWSGFPLSRSWLAIVLTSGSSVFVLIVLMLVTTTRQHCKERNGTIYYINARRAYHNTSLLRRQQCKNNLNCFIITWRRSPTCMSIMKNY